MAGGEKLVLLTPDCRALFAWLRCDPTMRLDGQLGVNCTIFRNEGDQRSSDLIREADDLAWVKWPADPRHFTYIDNTGKVASVNPGRCFEAADWTYVRESDDCPRCSRARANGDSPRGHRRTNARGNLYLMERTK